MAASIPVFTPADSVNFGFFEEGVKHTGDGKTSAGTINIGKSCQSDEIFEMHLEVGFSSNLEKFLMNLRALKSL